MAEPTPAEPAEPWGAVDVRAGLTAAMHAVLRMTDKTRDGRTNLSRMTPQGQATYIAAAAIYAYQRSGGGACLLSDAWKG